MASIVVDELVSEGEGVEPTARPDIPCDLFGLRREPALRYMLLDDDDMLVLLERGDDALTIEGFQRVARKSETDFPSAVKRSPSSAAILVITP